MIKIQNSSIKIHGRAVIGGAGGGGGGGGVGAYWYTTTAANDANKWHTLSSWYVDSNHTNQASSLPDANTSVVIHGAIGPIADLDRNDWVQPASINSGSTGVTFTSQTSQNVSINIVGNATFSGNATYNV